MSAPSAAPSARAATLAERFDPHDNGIDALRLVLASSVVLWHCFSVGGFAYSDVLERSLGTIGVDAFFVLSGFLITRSWLGRPELGRFLAHRALRILPGFWVCLVVTAVVLAPLGFSARTGLGPYPWPDALRYIVVNADLNIRQYGIGRTLTGLPLTESWNGPLYTLRWEALCYLVVAATGVAGLLRRRWVAPVAFVVTWAAWIVTDVQQVAQHGYKHDALRFSLAFAAGAALFALAGHIPDRSSWALLSAVVVAASYLSIYYRSVAIVPLAYLVLWLGLHLPMRIPIGWDVSYGIYIYSFVVQQVLVSFGVPDHGWVAFTVASFAGTAVMATASCRLVEVPALRLRHGRLRRSPAPA